MVDKFYQQLVLHPASLNVAFQTIVGAYSAAGEGGGKHTRSLHVPVHVDRIALSPSVCMNATKDEVR